MKMTCLTCHLAYAQCLLQCLAYSRCSINSILTQAYVFKIFIPFICYPSLDFKNTALITTLMNPCKQTFREALSTKERSLVPRQPFHRLVCPIGTRWNITNQTQPVNSSNQKDSPRPLSPRCLLCPPPPPLRPLSWRRRLCLVGWSPAAPSPEQLPPREEAARELSSTPVLKPRPLVIHQHHVRAMKRARPGAARTWRRTYSS